MYLSKLKLDTSKRDTASGLYNPQIFHTALEACFHGDRQHPLWRIDGKGRQLCMLILSKDKPDFKEFEKKFCPDSFRAAITDYDKYLERGFKEGNILRFRLAANPTVCITETDKKTGKEKKTRIPLNRGKTDAHPARSAEDWVIPRLQDAGCKILYSGITNFTKKTATKWHDGEKLREHDFVAAIYEGVVMVTDREKLAGVLAKGIGHEKAFGCGLLTVMPAM